MRIVEIKALENGAHRNQTFNGFLPDGWAVIPDDVVCENFPFGEVEVEKIDGVMTVTKWTACVIYKAETEESEPTVSEADYS